MTEQQNNLTYFGRLALRHWREFLPKMVAELEREGKLEEMAYQAQEQAKEEFGAMVEAGVDPSAAREIVLHDHILLAGEDDLIEEEDEVPNPVEQDEEEMKRLILEATEELPHSRPRWPPGSVPCP